jgi:hypothetical protein
MLPVSPPIACRPGCAACCIAPSISSPIPGMPHGKPAGVRCIDGAMQQAAQPGRQAMGGLTGSMRWRRGACGSSSSGGGRRREVGRVRGRGLSSLIFYDFYF